MDDYISREAAIEELCKAADCVTCSASAGGLCGFCTIGNASRLIRCLPAADVEPVRHGRWVEHKPGEQHRLNACIECSKCNIWFGYDCFAKTNYCPNCGAKMDLEGEE